jgi:hypothetical protein
MLIEHPWDVGAISQWTEVAEQATDDWEEPTIDAALRLDGAELAVAAALLELATEKGIVAMADSLFSHARRFTDDLGDPSTVLGGLEDSGLVVTVSNDWATSVVARWGPRTAVAIQGRCARILGKVALPRLVEIVFHLELRPKLGEFAMAQFGIGYLSLGPLGRWAEGAEPEPRLGGGSGYINRRGLASRLLLRGLIAGEVPFMCAVKFESDEGCAAARAHTMQLNVDTVAGHLQVIDAIQHPSAPAPIQRFALALSRATGDWSAGLRNPAFTTSKRAPTAMADEEVAEWRVQTALALRDLCSPTELMALELDRGFFLAWDVSDTYWEECVIHGAGFGQRRSTLSGWHGRYATFDLQRALNLSNDQTIVRRSGHGGDSNRPDPIYEEIFYRRNRAQVFNTAQRHLPIELEADHLAQIIEEGFFQQLADARALRESLALQGSAVGTEPRTLSVLVVLDRPTAGWMPGARSGIEWSDQRSDSESDQVRVEVVRGHTRSAREMIVRPEEPQMFATLFPDAVGPRGGGGSSSSLDLGIAQLIGHDSRDLAFAWPNDEQAAGPTW